MCIISGAVVGLHGDDGFVVKDELSDAKVFLKESTGDPVEGLVVLLSK